MSAQRQLEQEQQKHQEEIKVVSTLMFLIVTIDDVVTLTVWAGQSKQLVLVEC